jgi:hypothetical protein
MTVPSNCTNYNSKSSSEQQGSIGIVWIVLNIGFLNRKQRKKIRSISQIADAVAMKVGLILVVAIS